MITALINNAKKQPTFEIINQHLIDYPTPSNLNYFWNFGFLAGMMLVCQIVSGIILAMHYCPNVDLAFMSVEHIMRDVNYGWLIRYVHANGASMFFIVVYMHLLRGLYYGSYMHPREFVWCVGVGILILMMACAFIGYVLVWGSMSFWGATVITNLFSAIPVIGDKIVTFLWGGFSVDNATLNRFFSLHYLVPFLIAGLAIVHLAALHIDGSNNPIGINSSLDKISFFPYFYIKDLFGFAVFTLFFSYFVFWNPNYLGHSDNYIPANPMVTPAHIVPEWYFLPSYAILRSIPNKLIGVLALFASLLIFLLLPFINTSEIRSSYFRPIYRKLFWIWTANVIILGWIGGNIAESPYIEVGQVATVIYFAYFLVLMPALGYYEKHLINSVRIVPVRPPMSIEHEAYWTDLTNRIKD